MTEDDDGRWWLPEDVPFDLPLTFSLRATKDGGSQSSASIRG